MQYVSVKIPKVLALQIRTVLEQTGFTSVSDFILYAVRTRLEKLEQESKGD